MAASIEALFIVFGVNDKSRKSALSMEKFMEAICSWRKIQLGLLLDTSLMRVELPLAKQQKLITCINTTWHNQRKSFTLMEGMILIGNLEHAAQVCCWLRYCYVVLRHLINMLLKRARIVSFSSPLYHTFNKAIQNATSTDEKDLIKKFAEKKLAHNMYKSKDTMFITVALRQELSFLTHALHNPQFF